MVLSAFIRFYPCSSVFQRFSAALCVALPLLAYAEVTASDAWVRGTVPAQTATGAFVTLTSTVDAKVVAASSPIAKMVEIHETTMQGNTNHMHEVPVVQLPAGKAVRMQPGGLHVMLMGLAQPLKAGDSVPLAFTIEEPGGKRTRLEVRAEVRPLGAK